ncbi:hypothetical protein T492DRAFT_865429 [Pavlovales sp. CCMP2436]|nr:hypothetical protein T492DRAFT_865429 [Pavlovales sp. CCMP2436]
MAEHWLEDCVRVADDPGEAPAISRRRSERRHGERREAALHPAAGYAVRDALRPLERAVLVLELLAARASGLCAGLRGALVARASGLRGWLGGCAPAVPRRELSRSNIARASSLAGPFLVIMLVHRALAALILSVIVTPAGAYTTTNNASTFSSELSVSEIAAQIQGLIDVTTPDFVSAKALYDGSALQTLALADYSGDVDYDTFKAYDGGDAFHDSYLAECWVGDGLWCIEKTTADAIPFMSMLVNLNAALTNATAGGVLLSSAGVAPINTAIESDFVALQAAVLAGPTFNLPAAHAAKQIIVRSLLSVW